MIDGMNTLHWKLWKVGNRDLWISFDVEGGHWKMRSQRGNNPATDETEIDEELAHALLTHKQPTLVE